MKNSTRRAEFFTQSDLGSQERINVKNALVSTTLKGPRIILIGEDSLANYSSIHYNSE